MGKIIHVLSDTPDAFGVRRMALCGIYNPEYLATRDLVDLECRGIPAPRVRDEDPEKMMEGYRVCERCARALEAEVRRRQWRSEEKSVNQRSEP